MTQKHWYTKYLFAAISRIWRWSPARREALKIAAGRCFKCKVRAAKLHVDHVVPVVPLDRVLTTLDEYVDRRLGATTMNLQVLCVKCHKLKSKFETGERAKWRKKQKTAAK